MSQWILFVPSPIFLPGTGVCALIGDRQVAVFRPYADEQVFAISNIDPFAQASVLSRGLIAEHQGELWVASPLKKQHFRLYDGPLSRRRQPFRRQLRQPGGRRHRCKSRHNLSGGNMFTDTINKCAANAARIVRLAKESPLGFLISLAMAGARRPRHHLDLHPRQPGRPKRAALVMAPPSVSP